MSHLLTLHGIWLWVALAGVLVVTSLILAALMQMPAHFRRPLLNSIVFLAGLFYALEFFLPTHLVRQPNGVMSDQNLLTPVIPNFVSPFADVLSALLFGLGLISLGRIHIGNMTHKRPGWVNSLAFAVAAVCMLFFGLWSKSFDNAPEYINMAYNYLFNGMMQAMEAAMFSLIAFYILSASYRAFRIRSVESSILMISALIVLLGLSFGVLITSMVPATGFAANFRIETWSSWILQNISSPALRAIDFGVGMGLLAMSLRIWLGIERGALFGD